MKKVFGALVVLLSVALVGSGCLGDAVKAGSSIAKGGPKREAKAVAWADMGSSMAKYDQDEMAKGMLVTADGKPKYEYGAYGNAGLDKFFRSAKIITSSVAVTKELLQKFRTDLLSLAGEASDVKAAAEKVKANPSGYGADKLAQVKSMGTAVTDLVSVITTLVGEASGLISTATALPGQLAGDPALTLAIMDIKNDITALADDLKKVTDDSKAIIDELTALADVAKILM